MNKISSITGNPFVFEYETDLDIATCREIMTEAYFECQHKSDTHFFYKESKNRWLMIDPKKNGIVKLIVRVLSIWHTFKVRLRSEQGKTIIRCTYSNIFGSILANGTFIPIAILLIFPAMIFIPEPPGQMIKPALFTMLSFFSAFG